MYENSEIRAGYFQLQRGFVATRRIDLLMGINFTLFHSPSLGVKLPGREADHSPPSSAEFEECVELYFHSPNTSSWRGA
jgi:hypothetical protein